MEGTPRAEDEFVFVKSRHASVRLQKKKGWVKESPEEKEERREQIEGRALEQEIRSVSSSLRRKPSRDSKNIYFVVETDERASPNRLKSAFESLRASVEAYLDPGHSKILASMNESDMQRYMERKVPLTVKASVVHIRELQREELVSPRLVEAWRTGTSQALLHLMPSRDEHVIEAHTWKLKDYLQSINVPVLWESPLGYGMFVLLVGQEEANRILDESNLVFKMNEIPKAMITASARARGRIRGTTASLSSSSVQPSDLPKVCVLDSGVNDVTQLGPYVPTRTAYSTFANPDDEMNPPGHGTPVANLVVFGENGRAPRARIVSHKVISEGNDLDAFRGIIDGIERYSSECRVFNCSVNFGQDARELFAAMDKMIQERNICFVGSTGNILDTEFPLITKHYPDYIPDFQVMHPGQNAHVLAVGGLALKDDTTSKANAGGLSPFTRCGKHLSSLYDVLKPDMVEHGGNTDQRYRAFPGLGVDSIDKRGRSEEFYGTSFSAPLVTGRVAEILSRYGTRIQNSETLKAICYASCDGSQANCGGYGRPTRFISCDQNHAVMIAEGEIPLSDLTGAVILRHSDIVTVAVPRGVGQIQMYLAHSDNFHNSVSPSLDTYLEVRASKTGREMSSVAPVSQSPRFRYFRTLVWEFKRRSMEGDWDFEIVPNPISRILPEEQKGIKVRYGCVIVLKSRAARLFSLTEDVRAALRNERYRI